MMMQSMQTEVFLHVKRVQFRSTSLYEYTGVSVKWADEGRGSHIHVGVRSGPVYEAPQVKRRRAHTELNNT
jgi:hypothetical protein